jgi:hypothetical protein
MAEKEESQVRLQGAVPFEEQLAARERVLELCRQHGFPRTLVDARELTGAALPTTLDLAGGCAGLRQRCP